MRYFNVDINECLKITVPEVEIFSFNAVNSCVSFAISFFMFFGFRRGWVSLPMWTRGPRPYFSDCRLLIVNLAEGSVDVVVSGLLCRTIGENYICCVYLNEIAVEKKGGAVRQPFCLLHQIRDEQNRHFFL